MAEFYIEFDLLDGHSPGTGATLRSNVLDTYGWRSIGDPEGGRFINQTGVTIRAIHIKTNNDSNQFLVDGSSIGRLFDKAWFKEDGSEAIFMDANIPNVLGAFWMRTPANSRLEIQQCDSGDECPFSGQAFEQNPDEPTDQGWVEFRSSDSPSDERWAALRLATPSEYRNIQSYSESSDGSQILFLAKGETFLYSHSDKAVRNVSKPSTTSPKTNRITFESNEFLLWDNDIVHSRVKAELK